MKRGVALLLCLAIAAILCACAKQSAVPLTIGESAFGPGVYAWVLNEVLKDAGEDEARDEVMEKAAERCAVWAALDQRMKAEGVALSAPLKSETAERVRGEWQYFAAYYRARGIEKQDLTRVLKWEAQMKALTLHSYGEGSESEVSEKKLKEWFTESYVGFCGFFEALTKQNAAGETVPLSEAEQDALRESFDAMQKKAAAGESIDSLYKDYGKSKGLLATADADVTVLKAGDPTITDAFFVAVAALKTGESAVLTNGTKLWLLQKINLLEENTPYFPEARDDVLLAKKLPVVEKELREQADVSAAVVDEALCSEIYETVRAAR